MRGLLTHLPRPGCRRYSGLEIVSPCSVIARAGCSELLLFLEEQREADNRSIYQQSTNNRHDSGASGNFCRMPQKCWKSCPLVSKQSYTATPFYSVSFSFPRISFGLPEPPRYYLPIPMTTKKPVKNLPKSMTPDPELSIKSSGFAARLHIQFGSGAIT